ncbi:MAG: alpha/beta hydrolase [Atopobiaceae bacterium]|nr:alpha/beta hydrolase [Atopobiaceae bacterium]
MAHQVLGTGEALLMIHGIISDAQFFSEAAQLLSKDFCVIAYDRRGYGSAESPADDDYTVSSQADDAALLLEQYATAPAWVFGNSAGGLIAVELALRHPDLVRGLVLLEPSLVLDDQSKAEIAAWNAELNGYLEQGHIKRALPAFARVVGQPESERPRQTLAQMRRVFANLSNFMHGELNQVQRYAQEKDVLEGMGIPVRVMVTTEGRDGMFGRTSERGATSLGWPIDYVAGYHNVASDNPTIFSAALRDSIAKMDQ